MAKNKFTSNGQSNYHEFTDEILPTEKTPRDDISDKVPEESATGYNVIQSSEARIPETKESLSPELNIYPAIPNNKKLPPLDKPPVPPTYPEDLHNSMKESSISPKNKINPFTSS